MGILEQLKKPIILDPRVVMPLPQEAWDTPCSGCGQPVSKWGVKIDPESSKVLVICSKCMMYKSNWGKKYEYDLRLLIREVERERNTVFVLDVDGLLMVKDCDRLLSSIAITSRMLMKRMQIEGQLEGEEDERPDNRAGDRPIAEGDGIVLPFGRSSRDTGDCCIDQTPGGGCGCGEGSDRKDDLPVEQDSGSGKTEQSEGSGA